MPAIVPKPQKLASRSQNVILKRYQSIKYMPSTVAVKRRPRNSMIDGRPLTHHLVDVNKMVDLGSGSQREIDDMTSFFHGGRRELPCAFGPE